MDKNISVYYFTNIPAPYTVNFFNELGKKVKLTVIYELKTSSDRNNSWFKEKTKNYEQIFLEGKVLNLNSTFTFRILKYLKAPKNTIYVFGNYSSLVSIIGIFYLKIKKIPFIIHSDGSFINKEGNIKKSIKKFLLGSSNFVFSPNTVTDEYFRYYRKSDNNLKIFRYPFTSLLKKDINEKVLTHSEKLDLRIKQNVYTEEYVVLFVGSIINRKGIDILINVASFLPNNIGVYLVGGEITDEYQKLIEEKKIKNVHFIGFVDFDIVLNKYMYLADLFVFPTRYDIWGLVVNEAFSKGLPVITTKKCGAGLELIKEGYNGYLSEIDDYQYIANKILEIINNKDLLYKMSINSLDTIKDYTIENMSEIYYSGLFKFYNSKST